MGAGAGAGLATAERVRRRSEFEVIYTKGARLGGRHMTVFVVPNGGQTARLGVAATKKIGSAVTRNRAKRLAREMFRRHKPTTAVDVVIVPRAAMLKATFTTVEAEYVRLVERQSTTRLGERKGPHGREGRRSGPAKGL